LNKLVTFVLFNLNASKTKIVQKIGKEYTAERAR